MITKELKELVVKEATNLKENATSEELARLDFETLNPRYYDHCIYGQMTGSCFSYRSLDLLKQCAVPYSDFTYRKVEPEYLFADNGSRSFSPIEFYIDQTDAQNDTLIDFLKGKIETLTPDLL